MSLTKYFYLISFILINTFLPIILTAQNKDSLYIKITKMHKNLNFKEASYSKWIELEKDYLNTVIKKNEFILQRNVLTHYMTDDNTEVLFIEMYKNWENIEKAVIRSKKLESERWAAKQKDLYHEYMGQYFNKNQSDEIFMTIPGVKADSSGLNKSLFYQVRVNHLAFPKEGTGNEFLNLGEVFIKKAVSNNHYIKMYHSFIQVMGSDKRQFIEFTGVETLGDLEQAFIEIDEFLYEPKKEDEAKHNIFIANYFKYFTGFHADYIYKSVPELKK